MSERSNGRSPAPTLASVLHVANLRVALITELLVGASLFVLCLIALRFYMLDNLALTARSAAYAVEAAVVFDDSSAVSEALELIVANRPVYAAYVTDFNGKEIARWQTTEGDVWVPMEQLLAALLLEQPVIEPIRHNGQVYGAVKLLGSGRDLAIFVWVALLSGLILLLVCGAIASRLSRRASMEIVEPLHHLATVTAEAKRERRFGQRVEPAAIAELRDLGNIFNALLDELASWQAQMDSHNETLAYQANHDPLTGLANRTHFEKRLEQALETARDKGGHAALLFIDADRFKSINDELGHEVGDTVLRAIAGRLRAKVRETDLVARLGGDEFAVLLSSLEDLTQARRIAANMLDSVAEPIRLPAGATLHTSLSIGIAFFPNHASDAAGLLKKADEAMYESKRAGRGVYSIAL